MMLLLKLMVALPVAFWQMGLGLLTVRVGAMQAQLILVEAVAIQDVDIARTVTI